MRVLMAHNYYQVGGGEDVSFAAEADLLEARGHDVLRHTVTNDDITPARAVSVGIGAVWNQRSYREIRDVIRRWSPDVIHCQNTFPQLSPSVYYAARAAGVPVVQSLRNYRLGCLNVYLYRDGGVCEDCLGRSVPWPGVLHGCYRGSRAASAAVATMLATHRAVGTWRELVSVYVCLTEFARAKLAPLIEGVPAVVKPNFVYPDPGPGAHEGGYAVFVGRLSPEKGVDVLLDAWRRVGSAMPLRIVGDGPLESEVAAAAAELPDVTMLGRLPSDRTLEVIGDAELLVVPSTWYETFGRVAVEAYAKGTPVVASDLGAIAEVATTPAARRFPPGDAAALADIVLELARDTAVRHQMRKEARLEYERVYNPDRNYDLLMEIYRGALQGVA